MIETYFVETHEYSLETGMCNQVEYSCYRFEDACIPSNFNMIHDTILALGVF